MRQTLGLPPGTIVHVGKKKTGKVNVSIIDYDQKKLDKVKIKKISQLKNFKRRKSVSWVNLDGVHDLKLISDIGNIYGLHPLLLEDIANTEQRPKMDDYKNYFYISLKMLYYDEKKHVITEEQISMVLGKNFLITFQEAEGDVFDQIRKRIENKKGKLRRSGVDYLAYAIIDAIVDNYFLVLEKLADKVEQAEERILTHPNDTNIHTLYQLKRKMIAIRKSVWPLREVINNMERSGSHLIQNSTMFYLRDVYDHTIQVIDRVETFREILASMLDVHLSSTSNRLNEVMKVLTIIGTIFIPLTFITGVYGMNFKFFPEVEWKYGYWVIWGIMLGIASLMVVYFKRRKWI